MLKHTDKLKESKNREFTKYTSFSEIKDIYNQATVQNVEFVGVVTDISYKHTRFKKIYPIVIVRDKSSSIKLISFDSTSHPYQLLCNLKHNEVINVQGSYNPTFKSVKVFSVEISEKFTINEIFGLEKSIQNLKEDLLEIISTVEDDDCGTLLKNLFSEEGAIFNLFLRVPASRSNHHSFPGGLAVHSIEVCSYAQIDCNKLPSLNQDWVITAALIHDLGKVSTFNIEGQFTNNYFLNGHIIAGIRLVTNEIKKIKNFYPTLKENLIHVIASHHGPITTGWGSYVEPQTKLAWVIHQADMLSAKLTDINTNLTLKPNILIEV